MKIHCGLKQTPQGYQVGQLEICNTNFGGLRKYYNSQSLVYKRLKYATEVCKRFYRHCYPKAEIVFLGVIESASFTGEPATQEEFENFNN